MKENEVKFTETQTKTVDMVMKFNPTIDPKAIYNIVDDKHTLIDVVEGNQAIEELELTTWKDWFNHFKEYLAPKKTYIVVRMPNNPNERGTPVFQYVKSVFLSGISNRQSGMNDNLSGLGALMSQITDQQMSGLGALQEELNNKNSYINNLQSQISENYRSIDGMRDNFNNEKMELLDKMKLQEVRIKELEQRIENMKWQNGIEEKFKKQLEKANSGDMSQYLPMINMILEKLPGSGSPAPLPTMSGVKMEQPEVEYV